MIVGSRARQGPPQDRMWPALLATTLLLVLIAAVLIALLYS